MRKYAFPLLLLATVLGQGAVPAYAVNRDLLRMQEQLDTLQQMVQNMQKTIDSQTAIIRTLIEQQSDSINSMKAAVDELEKTNAHNLAATSNRFDSMTTQIQALGESLDEAKTRLAKLSDQVAHTQSYLETVNNPANPANPPANGQTPPGATTVAPPGGTDQPDSGNPQGPQAPSAPMPNRTANVPDPDTLYQSGLSYYNGGQYDLARQAFEQFLKNYGDTDLASNAQFYIGECYYSQQQYLKAINAYNRVEERYPGGNKQAAAQLKKGYALLNLGEKQAGIRELRSLLRRLPNTREADLARQRLKRLGA